jgi:hypothetical protein
LTIREIFRELAIARQRAADAYDAAMRAAWWSAALARQNKLPKLESLLSRKTTPQTMAQQKLVLSELASVFDLRPRATRLVRVDRRANLRPPKTRVDRPTHGR